MYGKILFPPLLGAVQDDHTAYFFLEIPLCVLRAEG